MLQSRYHSFPKAGDFASIPFSVFAKLRQIVLICQYTVKYRHSEELPLEKYRSSHAVFHNVVHADDCFGERSRQDLADISLCLTSSISQRQPRPAQTLRPFSMLTAGLERRILQQVICAFHL
jgi:hypothetical protein